MSMIGENRSEPVQPFTVAIVAGSAASAAAISGAMDGVTGHRILGYVDARSAFAAALRQAEPDVVVLEDTESTSETVTHVRLIRQAVPAGKVLLLAAAMEPERLSYLTSVGADAVIDASCLQDSFGVLVQQLAAGNLMFSATPNRRPCVPARRESRLTPREAVILRLVGEGYPDAAIAAQLWLTTRTVRAELGRLYEKLGLADRADAANYAQAQGLVDPGQALPEAAVRAYAAAA
jgi:DNA-binding NarL/FixJ family response regulator